VEALFSQHLLRGLFAYKRVVGKRIVEYASHQSLYGEVCGSDGTEVGFIKGALAILTREG
jgi:hypothetical protein